jgi:broad-specificity NMP kinase
MVFSKFLIGALDLKLTCNLKSLGFNEKNISNNTKTEVFELINYSFERHEKLYPVGFQLVNSTTHM